LLAAEEEGVDVVVVEAVDVPEDAEEEAEAVQEEEGVEEAEVWNFC
jgi:hypothetical protein